MAAAAQAQDATRVLREAISGRELPQEREGFTGAVEAQLRAALSPGLQEHEVACVWMRPGQFWHSASGAESSAGAITTTPAAKTTPAAYAASRLRRHPRAVVAVIALEWGVHSVSADISQVGVRERECY
jgi:hypothetical protein